MNVIIAEETRLLDFGTKANPYLRNFQRGLW